MLWRRYQYDSLTLSEKVNHWKRKIAHTAQASRALPYAACFRRAGLSFLGFIFIASHSTWCEAFWFQERILSSAFAITLDTTYEGVMRSAGLPFPT